MLPPGVVEDGVGARGEPGQHRQAQGPGDFRQQMRRDEMVAIGAEMNVVVQQMFSGNAVIGEGRGGEAVFEVHKMQAGSRLRGDCADHFVEGGIIPELDGVKIAGGDVMLFCFGVLSEGFRTASHAIAKFGE